MWGVVGTDLVMELIMVTGLLNQNETEKQRQIPFYHAIFLLVITCLSLYTFNYSTHSKSILKNVKRKVWVNLLSKSNN